MRRPAEPSGSVRLSTAVEATPGLAVEGGFFAAVYQIVAAIPRGRVCTYGGVSQQIVGRSTAARTVGWALHGLSAEEAERVPWWRVVNAQGRISTSCTEHSAELQRSLLEAEGVRFGDDDRLDLYRYGWWGPED